MSVVKELPDLAGIEELTLDTPTNQNMPHYFTPKTKVLGTELTYQEVYGNKVVASALKQPVYPDVGDVLRYMSIASDPEAAPATSMTNIQMLYENLQDVLAGHSIIVQAGLCAQDIDAIAEDIPGYAKNIHGMMMALGQNIKNITGKESVKIARLNDEKPRTVMFDAKGNHAFVGTSVNRPEAGQTTPDIMRLYKGRNVNIRIHQELEKLQKNPDQSDKVFSAREGLHLARNIADTRSHTVNGKIELINGGADINWLGKRTAGAIKDPRQSEEEAKKEVKFIESPHRRNAKLTVNPIQVKIGPDTTPEELEQLVQELNPTRIPGRLILVLRLGAKHIDAVLPGLMSVIAKSKDHVIPITEPMHENTYEHDPKTKLKTRNVEDMVYEVTRCVEIASEYGVTIGGIQTETDPEPDPEKYVTECLGDGVDSLLLNNKSLCDPCMNMRQTHTVIKAFGNAYNAAANRMAIKRQSMMNPAWSGD